MAPVLVLPIGEQLPAIQQITRALISAIPSLRCSHSVKYRFLSLAYTWEVLWGACCGVLPTRSTGKGHEAYGKNKENVIQNASELVAPKGRPQWTYLKHKYQVLHCAFVLGTALQNLSVVLFASFDIKVAHCFRHHVSMVRITIKNRYRI